MAKWLVPQKKVTKKETGAIGKIKHTSENWRRKLKAEWRLYAFITLIFGINIILFISRAFYFKDMVMLNPEYKNIFYIFSRACGKNSLLLNKSWLLNIDFGFDFVIQMILYLFLPGRCLNFSSMMVIVLVLRFTITKCRNLGLSAILPLDHNIFLHKLTGCTIFGLAWFHAIMHICNFCK